MYRYKFIETAKDQKRLFEISKVYYNAGYKYDNDAICSIDDLISTIEFGEMVYPVIVLKDTIDKKFFFIDKDILEHTLLNITRWDTNPYTQWIHHNLDAINAQLGIE